MSLMSSVERFQNVVLGGGEAGKYIAWELARWGQRVAVVEKGLIGGSAAENLHMSRRHRRCFASWWSEAHIQRKPWAG